jgi:hypothetical protein
MGLALLNPIQHLGQCLWSHVRQQITLLLGGDTPKKMGSLSSTLRKTECAVFPQGERSSGERCRVEQALGERSGDFYHVPALA